MPAKRQNTGKNPSNRDTYIEGSGSVEEEVLKNLKNKDNEENAVLNAVRARIEHLKQAE